MHTTKLLSALALILPLAQAAWGQSPALDGATRALPGLKPAAFDPGLAGALKLELPATVPSDESLPCGGLRVGNIAPAPGAVRTAPAAATWFTAPDGSRLSRIELHSPDATGLRVELSDPGSLELMVYDPEHLTAFGPYSYPVLSEEGSFWTTVIFGDRIGLELREPAGTAGGDSPPEILSVAYLFGDFERETQYPPPGTCDEDVNCYGGWANTVEENAVAILFFNCDENGCGQCTGALMNRAPSDFCPVLLTARHCISTQAAAATLIAIWFFNTNGCNGADPPLGNLPRNDGSLLLKTDFESEWTLLGLYEPDESGSYVGWDANYLSNSSGTVGISHPGGMSKRISFGTKIGDDACLGASEWLIQHWLGRTFPGASGSPLYDASHHVRGTLSCDNRECPTAEIASYAEYGRFDLAWPELSWYLYQMSNPTYVNNAVAGDAGNDGDVERGGAGNPFNTVYEGYYCVPAGGTVYIDPGNYNEQMTLWRPMTLSRWGASGTVVIGAP